MTSRERKRPEGNQLSRRLDRMPDLHEMLIEDEIVFCGLMLLLGIVTGAAARCVALLLGRRVA
jgi:hypothetical protein